MYNVRGFSLVEALVVVFIFSLLFAALLMVLSGGQASWYTADVLMELNQEMRRSLLTMNKELRQTRSTEISNVPADDTFYTTITFKIPEDVDGDDDVIDSLGRIEWSGDVSYSLNADNQIIRTPMLGSIPVLANYVSSLQFRRLSGAPDIIEIYITAQKSTAWGRNLQADIVSSVRMRN
jgi:type II secretory pathway pseudopilin PulG